MFLELSHNVFSELKAGYTLRVNISLRVSFVLFCYLFDTKNIIHYRQFNMQARCKTLVELVFSEL